MKSSNRHPIAVTGLGIVSAIGQGKKDVILALLQGQHNFSIMSREGRQFVDDSGVSTAFLGAEINDLKLPPSISKSLLRTTSLTTQAALTVLQEAWDDANLSEVEPTKIGLMIAGSNFQQRELVRQQDAYRGKKHFLRPNYGMMFMDTDVCGTCSEVFGITGFGHTVGGASASGQVAIIDAIKALESGRVDACIVIGALMDLSYWECQAFRSLGAMGSHEYSNSPEQACRPFDQKRDGFIFGESSTALVLERMDSHTERAGVDPYAFIEGWSMVMDGNRNPNPSLEGEVKVIESTLSQAGFNAADIDYVNPHGTGSHIGDDTELTALMQCGLNHAYINTTKSVLGHGLSAAGATELGAILLQMRAGQLHPSRNLENPISDDFNWVQASPISHEIKCALNLSMGFGGINTAICLRSC